MQTDEANAARLDLVRRLNAKLAPTHFIARKREAGAPAGSAWLYCIAKGDPGTAKYEIVETDIDLTATALRLGIAPSSAEVAA